MHKGRLLRIILIILILGMGGFILIRNNSLKKQLSSGQISEITARDFLPFGNSGSTGVINNVIDNIINNITSQNNETDKQKLLQISENIAGSIIIERPDEIAGPTGKDDKGNDVYSSIPAVRYVSKENGYVYDYLPLYNKSYLISDTAIPRVSFAHFSPDGSKILFQYLDTDLSTEKSVLGSLGQEEVFMLPDNIISFAFSKNGSFAYVRDTNNGSNIIIRSNTGTENIIYSSSVKEWNIQFLEENLLITTKASEMAEGYSYILDTKTKKLTRLWGGEKGLTTKTSFDGKYILQSITRESGPILSLYNTKTGNMSSLNKMGFVEKCSFSNDNTALVCAIPQNFENTLYPDAWYLGEIQTNDRIIRYTTENLNERLLDTIKDKSGQDIDIWNISTNDSGTITSFINKRDLSLWVYQE